MAGTAKRPDPKAALARYRAKRSFDITPEPSGDAPTAEGEQLTFCVQKHDATHLHYDFRLELDGVLKSWAVAKGPSYIPSERRLAVEVEDHPLDYGGFEGIIPKGQYGGGTVMLWDRGTWMPLEDPPHEGLRKGAIKFELNGSKLKGHWTLVRMPPRPKDRNPNWLLIKEKDKLARPDGPSLPENDDQSVLSRRTMAQIEKAGDKVWQSGPRKNHAERLDKSNAVKKKKTAPLEFVAPELATLAESAPSGNAWLHEIKFDGYRVMARAQDGKITLFTRKGLDWSSRFPEIADALAPLSQSALIDGEIVVLRPDGISDFSALQARLAGESDAELTFFAFDLLHFDGGDLRQEPLTTRKEKLAQLLSSVRTKGRVVYTDHVAGSGESFFIHGCKAGLEGIISKRADAPYRSGRIGDWLKVKCGKRQEFVIAGFVPPTTGMKGIGSLVMGVQKDGKLTHIGRVGTGYTEKVSRDLRQKLDRLAVKTQPFAGKLPRAATKDVIWVKPELVAEISFGQFTADGSLRHAAFKGLREDKPASEVVMEIPEARAKPAAKPVSGRDETEIEGVRLTHPDKVLDATSGLTKLQLATYYRDIAKWILPYLVDRPLSIVRCPEGTGAQCFYQRHINVGLPPDVHEIHPRKDDKEESYLTIRDLKGLLSLVQVGALEIHPWGAPAGDVEHPTHMIFDLDPDPSVGWGAVVEAALTVRDRLKKIGLKSLVKTTGGKGLHIVVPLDGKAGWDIVKPFAHNFADAMVQDDPSHFIAVMSKKDRKGKIFIDYLRNDRTATAVAPYSTRAREGAPVAVPVDWKELSPELDPRSFTIDTVAARLKNRRSDPWKEFTTIRQGIK